MVDDRLRPNLPSVSLDPETGDGVQGEASMKNLWLWLWPAVTWGIFYLIMGINSPWLFWPLAIIVGGFGWAVTIELLGRLSKGTWYISPRNLKAIEAWEKRTGRKAFSGSD